LSACAHRARRPGGYHRAVQIHVRRDRVERSSPPREGLVTTTLKPAPQLHGPGAGWEFAHGADRHQGVHPGPDVRARTCRGLVRHPLGSVQGDRARPARAGL